MDVLWEKKQNHNDSTLTELSVWTQYIFVFIEEKNMHGYQDREPCIQHNNLWSSISLYALNCFLLDVM